MPDSTHFQPGVWGDGTREDEHENEPPKIVEVTLDAPQFQVAAANPKHVEQGVAAMFVVALAGFAFFGAAYTENFGNFYLGVGLGVGSLAFGVGMVAWGKYLMPRGPFSESRHPASPTPKEREAFLEDFSSRGKIAIERRSLLVKLLVAAGGVFGIVAVFPLLRSLGPLPKKLFYHTAWRPHDRLMTIDGNPVHVDDLDKGGVLTVFPKNDIGGALSQTVLIRVESADFGYVVTAPSRKDWGPAGYVAFSKVCTHAGCPVSLWQRSLGELLCPCHQSIFEVAVGKGADGKPKFEPATPVFGPAPRPLPQLPLYVDSDGYLRAQRGYDEPVGPGFWERGST